MSILSRLFGSCTGFAGGNDTPQILILGLDKAGKTTLLYNMHLGCDGGVTKAEFEEMRVPDAKGETQDYGYHFEEIQLVKGTTCGVWEIPGTRSMRHVWSTFYRAIKIHAVLYVVNAAESSQDQIRASKRFLDFLMNEDELRNAVFAVVINLKDGRLSEEEKILQEQIVHKLGLNDPANDLHPSCAWRVAPFLINCAKIDKETDPKMDALRQWLEEKLEDPKGYGLKF